MTFLNLKELTYCIENGSKVKFKVKVIPSSKVNLIEFCDEFVKIKIKEKAIEGKANKALVNFLSDELKISKSKIKIINGEKSSIKTIGINL